jgi:hypothetical protein
VSKPEGEDKNSGGMRGKEVYTSPEGKENKVISMKNHEVASAAEKVISSNPLLAGATITRTGGNTFTMSVNGVAVSITMTTTASKAFHDTNDPGSVHGTDQGPAINHTKFEGGQWTSTVEINKNLGKGDLDKAVIHEFNEIAKLIAAENPKMAKSKTEGGYLNTDGTIDLTALNAGIRNQQSASVFNPAYNVANLKKEDLSAHDWAAKKEVDAVLAEASTALATNPKGAPEVEKLRRLFESMGIKYSSDPRLAFMVSEMGLVIPSNVQAYIDTHIGKDANQQIIMDRFHDHLMVVENEGNRIGGCHNDVIFNELVTKGEVKLYPVPTSDLSSTPGINVYLYKRVDPSTGVPYGNLSAPPNKKTTFDPKIWPDTRIIKSGTEGFEAALAAKTSGATGGPKLPGFYVDGDGKKCWTGRDSDGNLVGGHYKENGTNFEPTTFWVN